MEMEDALVALMSVLHRGLNAASVASAAVTVGSS